MRSDGGATLPSMAIDTKERQAARQRVAAIEADPLAAALQQIEHESAVKGAFGLVHALVDQLGGGPVTLSRQAIQEPDARKMRVEPQADGSVVVRLEPA